MMTGPFQSHPFVCRVMIAAAIVLATVSHIPAQDPALQISEEALRQLDQVIARFVEDDQTVGAELLVMQNGQVLLHTAHGFSDREQQQAWRRNTVCNIRSMTKAITSAAAQLLIDRGQLSLDEPVATWLNSFDNDRCREITVRHVLTHRSGFPLTLLLAPRQHASLSEQVDSYAERGPVARPGKAFVYSDAGADVVGRLVEVVSGESLHSFVQREILSPLGMKNTFYGTDGQETRLDSAASLYLGEPGDWNRFWKSEDGVFYPFAWGSQTLYSTTSDYARFLSLMCDNGHVGDRQLLSAAAVARMLEPVSPLTVPGTDVAAPSGFHGLRPFYGQMMVTYRTPDESGAPGTRLEVFGHSGSDGTGAWAWPEHRLIVMYFTQSRGGNTVLRLEEKLDDLLIHPSGAAAAIAEHLRPFVGTYIANFAQFQNEEFVVRVRHGQLVLDVPSQRVFELLEPDEQQRWAFAIVPDRIQVSFLRDEQNRVVALRLHQEDREDTAPRKGISLPIKENP